MTDPVLAATQRYLHEKIPLTRAMGVAVESYDGHQLILTAPLEPNHNHLGTAFGGSLSVITTLAGYAMLWLQLGDPDTHVVIKSSTLRYHRPVHGDLRAICTRPPQAEVDTFMARFRRTGKAGITLNATVEEKGRVCVDFQGVFVAIR